ncbi:fructose-2,6-bisphosphatase TIGAR B-like [Anguilla anguilla]|uniref:fructose-2,6-bisphosphatase TIGAR B-like n=1 Tax=Anguilla anguilla TaxID=7936 RepID=UPI0015AA9535|nr:fructose-2,6-bisphosphatase TIGAR B-like [Anguilla anguilla]
MPASADTQNKEVLTFGLTMVRHGETQYNKDKLLQGQGIDTPLSETGRQQAGAAGLYLRDLKFTNVFASSMLRARQTADIIVKSNAHCSGLEIVLDPLLVERSFGIAEGGPVQCMKDMAKAAGQSCPDFTPPQGETPEQVRERIRGFLKSMFQRMVADHYGDGQPEPGERIRAPPDGDEPPAGRPDDGVRGLAAHALVVGHGAYLRVAVRHLVEELQSSVPCGLKPSHLFSSWPNTGISRFVLTLRRGEGGGGPAPADVRCVFVNRKDHLKSMSERGRGSVEDAAL